MNHWLYQLIQEKDEERQPSFSVRAVDNWFQALRFEIDNEHGRTIAEQIASCRQFYSDKKRTNNPDMLDNVFESLFFSITYSMTLERFAANLNNIPWIRCTAIVDWYYSNYFSFRSMSYSLGQDVPNNHARMAKFVSSTLRTSLPYPFDITAHRQVAENYSCTVKKENPTQYDLRRPFFFARPFAQGMLAQYLNGTTKWYTANTKEDILRSHKNDFSDFRKKQARDIRDSRLLAEIGFLHCAYRQRVKANYKDSIYLSYNYGEEINLDNLIDNLSVSARFASIAAISFAERKIGKNKIQDFIKDLRGNLRGIENTSISERFWDAFVDE